MNIEISTYNLEDAQIAIATLLFKNHPGKSRQWYADQLGCSPRTLFRWMEAGKLTLPKTSAKGINAAISRLTKAGFTVTPRTE